MLNLAYNKCSININSLSSHVLYMCLDPLATTENTHTYIYNSHFIYEDFTDFIKSPNFRDRGMPLYNLQQTKISKKHKRKSLEE